jgi:hypothetical protein
MSHNTINEQAEKEAAAPTGAGDDNPESDLVWGGENVGRVIGRTKTQVYHLLEIGALDGAAAKIGHKTIVAAARHSADFPSEKRSDSPVALSVAGRGGGVQSDEPVVP